MEGSVGKMVREGASAVMFECRYVRREGVNFGSIRRKRVQV